MTKNIRAIGAAILLVLWLALTLLAWFSPAKERSDSERRPLAQFPELSTETILDGKFMSKFESYTLDQFPGRDLFRQLKALVHYNVLQQKDNNGYYFAGGYIGKLDHVVGEKPVSQAMGRLNYLYENYLKDADAKVYLSVIPDKGYYMAKENGYLAMDYDKLFSMVKEQTPWAEYIDITDTLTLENYYRTDTHWKQETLLPVAEKLTAAMGMTAPKAEDFTATAVDYPFYGVYYGQAAANMAPDQLKTMESANLSGCKVYTYDNKMQKVEIPMYDMDKLTSGDPYNMYLSGARVGLVQIENPNAATDKKLFVFRDSFGSSIAPLLVQDYASVTLIDIREIPSGNLRTIGEYIGLDFTGADVLMLYSTTVLNLDPQELK